MKDNEGYEGVWRTIRGARVFIRKGEKLDSAMARHKEKREKGLGTVGNEKIRYYGIQDDEGTDEAIEFSSLKDVDNYLKEIKSFERKNYGYTKEYTVSVGTDTTEYQGYKISKYKGKYKLK